MTILVVDNNDMSRQLLGNQLKNFQLNVLEARTSNEALELVMSDTINYIVCQERLNDVDGHDLCRQVRLTPQGAHVPFMLLVDQIDNESRAKVYAAGGQALNLSKDLTNILKIVTDTLQVEESDAFVYTIEELDQKQSEFISAVSHELRTPMTSIKSAVGLIGDGTLGPLNDEQKDFFQLLERNVLRLTRLIDEILNFSRIESGRIKVNKNDVVISNLVKDIVFEFESRAKEGGGSIQSKVNDQDSLVSCDSEKVHMILYYLLDNAFNHNPQGTSVVVGASRENGKVRLFVKDDGQGIPEEDQKKIFDRFHQVDRQVGDGSKGIGLGLAICKGLVEAHDSMLQIESTPGQGATFFFDMKVV